MSHPYRIREVDGTDEDIADTICVMHDYLFGSKAPPVDPTLGDYWWLAYRGNVPVGFSALAIMPTDKNGGYLKRAGVLPKHRGRGLQVRMVRAREAKARKLGLQYIITDTTYNTPSSNSLIKAGYKLYRPADPWGWKHTLYWKKEMK